VALFNARTLRIPSRQLGTLVVRKGWYNAGYIFPAGFRSRLLFRRGAGWFGRATAEWHPVNTRTRTRTHAHAHAHPPHKQLLANAHTQQNLRILCKRATSHPKSKPTKPPNHSATRPPPRSSVDLGALAWHDCTIVGEGGAYWPAPTFVVTARDRPGEPMVARSCTGCWSGVRGGRAGPRGLGRSGAVHRPATGRPPARPCDGSQPQAVARRRHGPSGRRPHPSLPLSNSNSPQNPCPQILKRIRSVIEARRAAGEALPPAPKTAIAGPEYFGLNDAAVRGARRAPLGDRTCII
jgi:hypothetical protein